MTRPTLIGFAAILLWSTLALLTAASGRVPPFQLAALTFLIGGLAGLPFVARRGLGVLKQSPLAWLHGVGGLFGYHFAYFSALRLAPPAEAGLIAYLWPLLIVLLSAALPGERLRLVHIFGALMGFAGTVVLITGRGGGLAFDPAFLPGYAAALVCAVIWAVYSVASRRFSEVPTEAVAGFCLATAVLSALAHVLFEETVWPADALQWGAVAALGLGPVGLAFYVWDVGMKRGDVRLLGVASYAAPVLSTLLLVACGFAEASLALGAACALIVGGALVATRRGRTPPMAVPDPVPEDPDYENALRQDQTELERWYGDIRHKPISAFSDFDMARSVRQKMHLDLLLPLALARLKENPLAGELYEGELMAAVSGVDPAFWDARPGLRDQYAQLDRGAVEAFRTV